ncbi:hypothetical protein OIV85_002596 [Enterococcus faecalis]|nr:hypothetical protein [Enterococcus faecalis]
MDRSERMSQSQQEAYQIMFKNTPQKFYQVVRMLSMMKQFAKTREQKKQGEVNRENEWDKFKELREKLGYPDSPDLEEKFKQLPKEQRMELIRDCEKKVLLQAGEKEYDFLLATNKMLAEPQILDKDINLDQLKNMMTDYGLQFHIKELPDLSRELFFYAKDANIAARAIERTLNEILEDPETVTKPTLETLIKQAKAQVEVQKQAKAEEIEKAKEASVVKAGGKEAAQTAKESLDSLSLFEELKGGIEL